MTFIEILDNLDESSSKYLKGNLFKKFIKLNNNKYFMTLVVPSNKGVFDSTPTRFMPGGYPFGPQLLLSEAVCALPFIGVKY